MSEDEIETVVEILRTQLANPHCRVSIESNRPAEEIPSGDALYRSFRPGPRTVTTITLVTDHEYSPVFESIH